MQRTMRVLRRPALSVAILSLLSGTGHQAFFGVSGIGSITWQWTDFYLGTPLHRRPADDPRKMEVAKIFGRVWDDWRQRRQLQGDTRPRHLDLTTWKDLVASAMNHGLKWEQQIFIGRNPLHLLRDDDAPFSSASQLRRMQEEYWPLIKEYLDAPEADRKKLLDAWIPAINDATLEAKLRKAIKEQWRLEIGPGQKNDPHRLPRNIREGAKIARRHSGHFFGEDAKEGNAWSSSSNWILDLERTFAFGFGYQLLRSCAVDGYDEQYFRHVEKKWLQVFRETHNWVKRVLNAMQPPPGEGLPGDKVGKDEKVSKATYDDRRAFWAQSFLGPSFLSLSSESKLGVDQASPEEIRDFYALLANQTRDEGDENHDGEEAAKTRDAVRSILELPADSALLNEQDIAQQQTGGRLSLYPKTLALAETSTFRARRSVIEGERQTEDLRIYAEEGMRVLQSALLPFTYSYKSLWSRQGERDAERHVWADIKQELKNAVETSGESLSPKAKAVARHALRVIENKMPRMIQLHHYLEAEFSAEVPSQGYESPGAVYIAHPWEEKINEGEAERVDDNAGNACVRLFAWAKRHQVLSRMARLNLATRLKVLVSDGVKFGGELSQEDLIEREKPTAVGPVVGKSGSPLALKENQDYTNLFYLLRDNVGKKLEEFAPLKWQDFDEWAKQYPHLVLATPWDEEYVPPWEWPNGVPPDRGDQKQDDESYYRRWFFWAVAGIAVFALGLAVVLLLLILECRRHRAAVQRRRETKRKREGEAQDPPPTTKERNHDYAGAPRQRVRFAAPPARGVNTTTTAVDLDVAAPHGLAFTRLAAEYPLYVRDHEPIARQPNNNKPAVGQPSSSSMHPSSIHPDKTILVIGAAARQEAMVGLPHQLPSTSRSPSLLGRYEARMVLAVLEESDLGTTDSDYRRLSRRSTADADLPAGVPHLPAAAASPKPMFPGVADHFSGRDHDLREPDGGGLVFE